MPLIPGIVTSERTMSIPSPWTARWDSASALLDDEAACFEHSGNRRSSGFMIVNDQNRLSGPGLRGFGHTVECHGADRKQVEKIPGRFSAGFCNNPGRALQVISPD